MGESAEELRRIIAGVTSRRPRVVLDHILAHGQVTTDELRELYGYDHPLRAARDVREQGIPLVTTKVVGASGRRIAAYKLPDTFTPDSTKTGGRRSFSKGFKQQLVARDGEQRALCSGKFPASALQIDHRIPYQIAGDALGERNPDEFMLVCASCNRAKSWSCEHCENWRTIKDATICQRCFWAFPLNYNHIAMQQRRSLTLNWAAAEIQEYSNLQQHAEAAQQDIAQYTKQLIRISLLTDDKE